MASEQQLLERIDRTLDRIDARLEQGDRRFEEDQRRWKERDRRWEERDRQWKEHWGENERRWEVRDADLKTFIREMTARHVHVTQEMIGAIQELGTEIADQRSQLRANTEATWRLLERFGPQRPQG